MPAKPDRRIDPPRFTHKIRLVRAADTTHNLRASEQVMAIVQLIATRGGPRR